MKKTFQLTTGTSHMKQEIDNVKQWWLMKQTKLVELVQASGITEDGYRESVRLRNCAVIEEVKERSAKVVEMLVEMNGCKAFGGQPGYGSTKLTKQGGTELGKGPIQRPTPPGLPQSLVPLPPRLPQLQIIGVKVGLMATLRVKLTSAISCNLQGRKGLVYRKLD
eukprot:s4025_g8.t1